MTLYSELNNWFLNKISDYSFLTLTDVEIDNILSMYMKSAITKFGECKQDLSLRDDVLKQFNIDLEDGELEILATLMIVEWLTPKIHTGELLRQKLGDKEYKIYSQANHLKEVRELRDAMKEESENLIMDYSYSIEDLEDLI